MNTSLARRFLSLLPTLLLSACGAADDNTAPPQDLISGPGHELRQGLDDGSYTLYPSGTTNWCVGVKGDVNRNGQSVVIARCSGKDAQKWTLRGDQIRIFGNKCLNVTDGADKDGTKLQIWTCSDEDTNSKWSIRDGGIVWANHRRVVDLTDGTFVDGAALQLWTPYGNNTHQDWKFSGSKDTSEENKPSTSTPAPTATDKFKTNGPAGLDVAPYFFSWAKWGSQYSLRSPMDAWNKAGARSLTMAFGLSGGGCNLSRDLSDLNDEIKAFISQGGRIILSFGGANGTYPQDTCSNAQSLADAIAGAMKDVGTHSIDFDIEGGGRILTKGNDVLIDALAILQKKYQDLYISYTLAVDAKAGLPAEQQTLIKKTQAKNVILSRINIMTMDFGSGQGTKDVGDMSISAADKTIDQLGKIYTSYSKKELFHILGITPMIGRNDDGLTFTLADAKSVADYAKKNGVGMLSFWAIQRDQNGSGSFNDYSKVDQKSYDYLHTFQAAQK